MPGTPIDAWPISGTAALSASSDEVAKQAIQDVARHEEQVVKLILFHDDRALRVLSVYVPVIGALITAVIALHQAEKLTLFVGLMMGGTATSLLVGCFHAFAVVWTAPIYLPSRRPQFWQWAIEHDVELRLTAMAYVNQSISVVAHNERHSARASDYLTKAYTCGVAAPFVGAAIVWIVYWSRT
jgi:hypothetical protein